MENKLTDEQIIKALEHRVKFYKDNSFAKETLDLINRLKAQNKEFDEKIVIQMGAIDWQVKEINRQKAEVERLKHILINFMVEIEEWEYKYNIDTSNIPKIAILGMEKAENIKAIKGNAIKEFAERLKEKATSSFYEEHKYVDTDDIDNLVKEMEGE